MLRKAINVYSRSFDEPFTLMLVFDPCMFLDLEIGDIQQCSDLLSSLPNTHFISILPLTERQPDQQKRVDSVDLTDGLLLDTWYPSYAWKGVVLRDTPSTSASGARLCGISGTLNPPNGARYEVP